MNPEPAKRGRWVLGAVLFLAAAALASYWLAPRPSRPRAAQAAANAPSWSLPQPPNPETTGQSFHLLRQQTPWGASNEPKSGGPTAEAQVDWRLKGVVREKDRVFALVLVGDETRRYRPGDELPGGALLEEVLADGIKVKDSGGVRLIPLYPDREPDAP
jgi:hypothetical protein